ncbi:MAG: asparagine synthase (glutamine-hydrolyzing) [Chloroflexi bacterium]|nr:MAG: asparagine synthase (glutamine-hydrolyzing) [Chloroflexota bacterium]
MCGIVGVLTRDGSAVDEATIVGLRDTMIHRGPDDAGVWRREPQGNAALAVRRLAIIDTSDRGHQPMANEDGTVRVAFNGEIYNHAILRAELERRGHRFRSHCDTEVLVHLYEEHGPSMVEQLVGMFAFAIWDEAAQHLLLARDRLGVKPLYWLDDGSRFAFASEIKALLPLLPRREVDPIGLWQYLTFVAVPPPRTLFAGIAKLGIAETMLVTRDGPQPPRRYWDPIANRTCFDGEAVAWERELQGQLLRSVERQMMSDVPVGAFLSGGVDSSTNVALMSRLSATPVNTFSIGYEGRAAYNEFSWARQIAERFHTAHRELVIGARDFWQAVPGVIHHLDEPTGGPVNVSVYLLAQLARDAGVKVIHLGEGGDEIFAGYDQYLRIEALTRGAWRRFRRLPRAVRQVVSTTAGPLMSLQPRLEIRREAMLRATRDGGRLWWGQAIGFYSREIERVSTSRLRRLVDRGQPGGLVLSTAAEADAAGARDELDRIIYQDLRLRLPEQLLMRDDKLTMASSVEGRFPLLDQPLVELAMAMPFEEKVRNGVGKHVLKRVMSDVLPEDLLWRQKQAFRTPLQHWLRSELAGPVERRLRTSAIHELGYLDREAVQRLFRLHLSAKGERSYQIWALLSLCLWFDYWIAGRELTPD